MDLEKNKEPISEADRSKWTVHNNHNIKRFTEREIQRITDNYKTTLGRGAFGVVYKGVLEDKRMVAVKRFIRNGEENFDQELTIHREINHKNVVRLIGYCVQKNALTMVSELMPNGNLAGILHHDNTPIPLEIRLRIATQCAEALTYMHSYMYTQVIHGDIKPDNILLDGNLNAKISDFGIARPVNTDKTLCTGNIVGSIGYMDPLFTQDGRVTAKSDVYSFGIVLLELLTRKKATSTTDGEVSTVNVFTSDFASGGIRKVRKLFDSELDPLRNRNILDNVGTLAAECLNRESRAKRPEMKHVAERLGTLGALFEGKQRVDLLDWRGKSKVALVNIPDRASPLCRRFSAAEMAAATRNFDESFLLGQNDYSRFYRGMIDDGVTIVAVERLWHVNNDGRHLFHSFVDSRSKLCHSNVVPLIGYCDEYYRILVYKYMDQGSLREHLFGAQNPPLTWKQRLEICIGAARGLNYLHTGAEHAVIHRNVKPANILLDEECVAKISGNQAVDPYSLTKVFRDGNARDPEFESTMELTEKSDVYSFGVVLLEVLCAQPHFELGSSQSCPEWDDDNRIDPYLKGKINPRCLRKFIETANECLASPGIHRPSMEDVVSDLESALQLQISAG